jgi:predicted TPR repeat methyltransferase
MMLFCEPSEGGNIGTSERELREERLERVYGATSEDELTEAYDEWAADYEGDMLSLGYMVPSVAAGFIGRHVPPGGKFLDAGLGTGILGDTLRVLGYTNLTGIDLSERMMDIARKKGAYENLRKMTLGETLDFPDDSFDAAFSIGVFTEGHAPPESLDELVRVVKSGGWMVFGVREDVYENGGFREKMDSFEADGKWSLVEKSVAFTTFPAVKQSHGYRMFAYRVS